MMINTKMQHARAGAAAIAAVLALSPTYGATPKPIVDLSQSPAISGQSATPAAQPARSKPVATIGGAPIDERTIEIGGGALAIVILGSAVLAMRSRKRRRADEEAWDYEAAEPATDEAPAEEPMTLTQPVSEPQPAIVAPAASAFAWGKDQPCDNPTDDGSDRCPGETWVERAYRGPTADNPSVSLRTRLKRAAFFDKRERDVAAGIAEPVEMDAGLPDAMIEEQEREPA